MQSRTGAGAYSQWDEIETVGSKVWAWVPVQPLVTKQLDGLGLVFLPSQVRIVTVTA